MFPSGMYTQGTRGDGKFAGAFHSAVITREKAVCAERANLVSRNLDYMGHGIEPGSDISSFTE